MKKQILIKLVAVAIMVVSLGLDAFAIKVVRTRRHGDGSGNYGAVERNEHRDSEGVIYEVTITCENPGPLNCPMSIVSSGIGVENLQHEAALIPHLDAMYNQAVVQCQDTGSYSGSDSKTIVDSNGNLGVYVYSLNMTYNAATQDWDESWEINKLPCPEQ